jgi:multidrug efflux pump subunit AcrB
MSDQPSSVEGNHRGFAGALAAAFVRSRLTPLIILTTVLLGIAATVLLPREEEPQIKVPMIDVLVSMPGSSVEELENRVTRPMEKLLWEIPGVEYVYSTSRDGSSMAVVRFKVGHNIEEALIKLNQKLQTNFDRIPFGAARPLIKPKTIDDVPVLALTLHGGSHDHYALRRMASELADELNRIPDIAETTIIGGTRRQVRVLLDPTRVASRNLSIAGLVPMLQQANRQLASGGLTMDNREFLLETGGFLADERDVSQVVVGVYAGKPVYLRDVAEISDGPEEPLQYVLHGAGASESSAPDEQPAVTITFAKRPGTNATFLTREVLRRMEELRPRLLPREVTVSVTRDYGATAAEKSDELLLHMGIAVAGVSLLILFLLGWREAGVVALAIPSTLALTLLTFYMIGYTLNRITLFALIFSIGILVDDAIVVVENIVRHYRLPHHAGRSMVSMAIEAVSEVGNPTVLATWAVIAAIAPMAFVGGLMGPYMRPIPVGASAAMFFSLIIAFVVAPWAAVRLLRAENGNVPGKVVEGGSHKASEHREDFFTRLYRHVMAPLLRFRLARWAFLVVIMALLGGSFYLVVNRTVLLKMLPFDNKNEFQVILNMPEGVSLERTAQAARQIAAAIRTEPEVASYQAYIGAAAPFNFNGLVRHYYMRGGASSADIQVNLVGKEHRKAQSHDIALRVRPKVAAIAKEFGARVAVAEVPPGPPVLQTLVAEVYGPTAETRQALAAQIRDIFNSTPGIVDVDWYHEEDRPKTRYIVDKEKAALNGISASTISTTLQVAVQGMPIDLVHRPQEKEDLNLVLELPRSLRSSPEELLSLRVRSGDTNALPENVPGAVPPLVPLRELVRIESSIADKPVYHKNLVPVVYVTADVAGELASPAYAILEVNDRIAKLDASQFGGTEIAIHHLTMPQTTSTPSIKWDGEWHITLEVFRDLGMAFIAALILIYLLMVGWFRSYIVPAIIMSAIPFSLIGILPAHGAMGVFFSATSMIGFMAGAGIVIRNSIILVDFIELRRREGMPLDEAVVDAGAVRFRPMLLTALAVIVGASVILADPIFKGLAISLLAGEIASLLLSRMAVPVLYFMANPAMPEANQE